MPIEPLPGHRPTRTLADTLRVVSRNLDVPTGDWTQRLEAAWPELVGGRLAKASSPSVTTGRRLVVEVTEPVVAEQFRLLAGDLVSAVNRWAEEDVVGEVSVRVGRPGSERPQW